MTNLERILALQKELEELTNTLPTFRLQLDKEFLLSNPGIYTTYKANQMYQISDVNNKPTIVRKENYNKWFFEIKKQIPSLESLGLADVYKLNKLGLKLDITVCTSMFTDKRGQFICSDTDNIVKPLMDAMFTKWDLDDCIVVDIHISNIHRCKYKNQEWVDVRLIPVELDYELPRHNTYKLL